MFPLHLFRVSCDTKRYTRCLRCSFNLLIYYTLLETLESINLLFSDICLLTHVGIVAESLGARAGKSDHLKHSRLLYVLTVYINHLNSAPLSFHVSAKYWLSNVAIEKKDGVNS